jgi:hypothetical protein
MLVPPARTVAVIDDDRRVLTSLVNLLASGGYETRAYESALNFFSVPAPVVWTRFCSSGGQLHQPFLTGFEG